MKAHGVAHALKLKLLAMQNQSRWGDIVDLQETNPDLIPESRDEALVMGRAFRSAPAEQVILPGSPVTRKLDPILTGQPGIALKINGKTYTFLLDTGVGMTVLTDGVAQACGGEAIGKATGFARTSTSKRVAFRPGVVDRLESKSVSFKRSTIQWPSSMRRICRSA